MALGRLGTLLGIDPGLAATGYGVIEDGDRVVSCGTIRTQPGPTGPRLAAIASALEAIIAAHPPSEASIEELFAGRNTSSALAVAQARGVLLLLLERAQIPVYEYKPAQVKAILTGYGDAGKPQMARMLAAQLHVDQVLDDHAVDALAIALCHLRSRRQRHQQEVTR
ncbi:MAG: crossover junction endodeoxyribonuclease RuvC [Candidatus Dormibacteraceae bacterium]